MACWAEETRLPPENIPIQSLFVREVDNFVPIDENQIGQEASVMLKQVQILITSKFIKIQPN